MALQSLPIVSELPGVDQSLYSPFITYKPGKLVSIKLQGRGSVWNYQEEVAAKLLYNILLVERKWRPVSEAEIEEGRYQFPTLEHRAVPIGIPLLVKNDFVKAFIFDGKVHYLPLPLFAETFGHSQPHHI